MKTTFVENLRERDTVGDFFVVAQVAQKTTKTNKQYLDLLLSDRTGSITGRAWDNVERLSPILAAGKVVKLEAMVESYQGELQLKLLDARDVRPADKIDQADFLPKTPHDIEDLYRQLLEYKNSIATPAIRTVLDYFFDDEQFAPKFKKHPAAKAMHHAYVGGLLEHTLSVVKACDALLRQYEQLDRDLLLAGALLHDIGKVRELDLGFATDYSIAGQLVGHLVIGAEMIAAAVAARPGIPDEIKWQLQHFVLSHHGQREFGSPVLPMTREALALHALDNLDAKLFQVTKAMQDAADQPAEFTQKIYGLDRGFYKRTSAPAGPATVAPVTAPPQPPKAKARPKVELDLGNPAAQERLL